MILNKLLNLWPPFGSNEDEGGDDQGIDGILKFNADGSSETVNSGTATATSIVGILKVSG